MEKILYKKDSKGKIRVCNLRTNGAELIQESGLIDGKLVLHSKICTPKNVGKSNETTGEQQAILELESEWKQKKDEGYFETVKEAEKEEVILPMLAKSYNDEKGKIDWSGYVFIQPKLDGQRMLAIKKNGIVKLLSRDGKEITTLNHIIEKLENRSIPDNIYDGEAYNLELGGFQNQMKAIKSYKKGITEKINFNIYDLILDKPFSERYKLLKKALNFTVN